jgi:hypothetical protein
MCSVPRGCPVSASSQCCAHGLDPLRALPSQRTQSDCACGFVQGASARVNLKTIASDSLTQTSPTANGSGKRTMMTSLSRCHCPSPSSSPSLTSPSRYQGGEHISQNLDTVRERQQTRTGALSSVRALRPPFLCPSPPRAPSPSPPRSGSPSPSCVQRVSHLISPARAPAGKTHLFLNSSGTSTLGWPSCLSLASSAGFSSCCVRLGRETYGRAFLHWYVKWPVPRHFWHIVVDVARAAFVERCGAYLDMGDERRRVLWRCCVTRDSL